MSFGNRIEVVIDKVVYELTSSESVEYIQTVANYIDRKIKSIYSTRSEAAMNPRLRTLFISLNIADDLFKEKEKTKALEQKYEKELTVVREENWKLKKEFTTTKAELDNYKYEVQKAKQELEDSKIEFEKVKQELDERIEDELRRERKLAPINGNANNNSNSAKQQK
ncbi:MAG: cell division protein ZapA [Defluviitaleaceae bacterium]|nr:cell division protein ZapA [Defluviitaleaceae bacterium]